MVDMYKDASTAYNSGDYLKLLLISVDLGIKVDQLEDSHYASLKSRIDMIDKEIRELKATLLWAWQYMTEKQKVSAVVRFGKAKGWKA